MKKQTYAISTFVSLLFISNLAFSQCNLSNGGYYINQNIDVAGCNGTSLNAPYTVWGNEMYMSVVKAGGNYTFSLAGCDQIVWGAPVEITVWEGSTVPAGADPGVDNQVLGGTAIAHVTNTCSVNFTASLNDTIFFIVNPVGDCGGAIVQTDNGVATITTNSGVPCFTISCALDLASTPCLDQIGLDDEFAAWLTNFSATSGCGIDSETDLTGLIAPSACEGGSVLVDYTVLDSCGNTGVCTAVFTDEPALPVIVNCAEDIVNGPCMDQATIDADFNTWLSNFYVIDPGCGEVTETFTYNVYPDACAGSVTTLTYFVTDACGNTTVCDGIYEVAPPMPILLNCPPDMAMSECTDQSIVNSAFADWLTGFYVIDPGCGASEIGDISNSIVPVICTGGTAIVEYWAVDFCGNFSICSSSFILDSVPPITLIPPPDVTYSSCDFAEPADLEYAYREWLKSGSVSGGCNTEYFIENVEVPDLCTGGTAPVTFLAYDDCMQIEDVPATFVVEGDPTCPVCEPPVIAIGDAEAVNAPCCCCEEDDESAGVQSGGFNGQ